MADGHNDEPDATHPLPEEPDAQQSDFTAPPPPLSPPSLPTSTGGWTLTDSGMIPEVPPDPEEEPEASQAEPETSEPETVAFAWNLDASTPDADPGEGPGTELLHVPTYEATEILDTADADAAETTVLQQPATRAERRQADAAAALAAASHASAATPQSRGTRTLIGVAIALVAVLALIGLFILGTRLPAILTAPTPTPTATPTHSATPTPTPTPTPTVMPKPTVAQSAGVHEWSTLGGGECLQPYTTPWAETFTVVDCRTPHAGQMVYTNLLSADPKAAYPGADAIAKQINILCTKPGIVNLEAAGAYPDLQLQGSYPATAAQWTDGDHSYFCFASRSSAKPLTTSVAGKGPTG